MGRAAGRARWGRGANLRAGTGKPGPQPAGAASIARRAGRHGRRDLPGRSILGRLRRRAPHPFCRSRAVHRLWLLCEPALSARRRHRPVNPLEDPGNSDLSAHVDFAALADAARAVGAAVWGLVPQGRFLAALGAEARLRMLSERAGAEQRAILESGLRRLIDPSEMGTLFKAMALASPGLPMSVGFADAAVRGGT